MPYIHQIHTYPSLHIQKNANFCTNCILFVISNASKKCQNKLKHSPKLKWIRNFILKHIFNYSILSKNLKYVLGKSALLLKGPGSVEVTRVNPPCSSSRLFPPSFASPTSWLLLQYLSISTTIHYSLSSIFCITDFMTWKFLQQPARSPFRFQTVKLPFSPQCTAANATRNQVLPAQTMNSFSILMKIKFSSPFERDWPHRASESLFS